MCALKHNQKRRVASESVSVVEWIGRSGNNLIVLLLIILMAIVFRCMNPRFLFIGNIRSLSKQLCTSAFLAIGITFVLVGSGTDLSVGSIMSCCSVVLARVMVGTNSIALGIICCVLVGAFFGLCNGILVSHFKVQPFAATLGMSSTAMGIGYIVSDGVSIVGLPKEFSVIGSGSTCGVPNQVYILAAFALVLYTLLHHTAFGSRCFAVGGNNHAAKLSGVNVKLIRTLTFIISGTMAAVASVIATSRVLSGQPTIGDYYTPTALASAIIGGASMSGGRGSLVGTLLGVLFITMLSNGLNFMGVSTFMQNVVLGMSIIIAVCVDSVKRKKVG